VFGLLITPGRKIGMDDSVVVVAFADQSKAYQALSQLRQADAEGRVEVRATVLLERGPDGAVRVPEGDDVASGVGVAAGSLIGMLIGVLGGPLGVLLGGYGGLLAGGLGAADREEDREVALDAISKQIEPGHTVLVAEVGEVATEVVDDAMSALGGTVIRRPAEDVYAEIQGAKEAQYAADAEARRVLRAQRRAEHKEKWEQFKDKVKSAVKS
jgi:uncharacterized membrane protein